MAFVVDLSGKRAAEREMEHLRIFLDSIVENLPNMVFVKDAAELRFVRFNRAGEDLLGFRFCDLGRGIEVTLEVEAVRRSASVWKRVERGSLRAYRRG